MGVDVFEESKRVDEIKCPNREVGPNGLLRQPLNEYLHFRWGREKRIGIGFSHRGRDR